MESSGFLYVLWGRTKLVAWISWLLLQFFLNKMIDITEDYFSIIRKEGELFAGVALVLIGLLGFNAGRMCDGNTADYLSCTRPSAFHYYTAFDIALVVIGVTLVMVWYFRRTTPRK